MDLMLTFSREEISKEIPYAVICEARYGAVWDTGRRRRLFTQEFTMEEMDRTRKLFKLAHRWALSTGVPKEVKMTLRTYKLWQKLGAFCAAL